MSSHTHTHTPIISKCVRVLKKPVSFENGHATFEEKGALNLFRVNVEKTND